MEYDANGRLTRSLDNQGGAVREPWTLPACVGRGDQGSGILRALASRRMFGHLAHGQSFLAHSSPLLEEKRHIILLALLADTRNPPLFDWTRTVPTFTTDDYPANPERSIGPRSSRSGSMDKKVLIGAADLR